MNDTLTKSQVTLAKLGENHGASGTRTLGEKASELDELIDSNDFVQKRGKLIAKTVELSLPYPLPADLKRLVRLGRDGHGSGNLLAGLDRMLENE